jgi:hypothetical protein
MKFESDPNYSCDYGEIPRVCIGMSIRLRFAATIACLLAGCGDPVGTSRSVVLGISELSVPAEAPPGTAVLVKATVVTGGCLSFTTLEATRTSGRVTLIARGRDASGPNVSCPADIRYTVHEYRAEPPLLDPFTVVARQPDGTTTTKVVRIR